MDIEDMLSIGVKYNLTLSQVGYMVFAEKDEKYPLRIDVLEKSDLSMRKMLENGMATDVWKEVSSAVSTDRTIAFGYTDEVMEILQMVNSVLREDDMEGATVAKILKEFNNNEQLGVLFCIWLSLFPTSGKKNVGWDKLFGIPYMGFTLRIFTPKLSNFFKKVARRKDTDMSMFVLGTYLFIRSYIKNGKAFIPKIQRFLDTWEEWHAEAINRAGGKSPANIMKLFELEAVDHRSEYEIKNETVEQVGFVMD